MPSKKGIFLYGKDHLTPLKALGLSQGSLSGELSEAVIEKINKSNEHVAAIVEDEKVVYGINTGFGSLCHTIISRENTQKLQDNLIRSHSVGVGDPVPQSITRLMLILKIQSLSLGFSGISLNVIRRMMWFLNKNYIPFVPTKGSLGASGDLAPLAHMFLPLIGLGKVYYNGEYVDTQIVYKKEGLDPLSLGAKEGLALINGTQFMGAYTVEILDRLFICLEAADIISAMTIEGLLGSAKPFDEKLHLLRPFNGSQHVA